MTHDLRDAAKTIRQFLPLLQLLTVRQVIEGGSSMIEAAGLDPWCMNEGKAQGDEPAISGWQVAALREACDDVLADPETADT